MRSSKPALAAALVPQKARSNEDSKDRRLKGADRVELAHLLSGKLPADRAEIFSQLRFVSRADQNGRDCRTLQHPVERDLWNRLPVAWTTSSSALTSVPRRSVTLVEIATSSRRPLMAAPRMDSDAPSEYTSAVSKKFKPASRHMSSRRLRRPARRSARASAGELSVAGERHLRRHARAAPGAAPSSRIRGVHYAAARRNTAVGTTLGNEAVSQAKRLNATMAIVTSWTTVWALVRLRDVRVDHLPLAVAPGPDVCKAQRNCEWLTARSAFQMHQAAHDGTVVPHLLDRL